jgi:hypothetical protein
MAQLLQNAPTSTTTRSSGACTFRLFHGAGQVFEVPGEKLDGVGGPSLDALLRIAREHIRDPELIRTLHDDRLVLQVFSSDPDAAHQRTVSSHEDFSKFSSQLTQQNVEMSASIRHDGGTNGTSEME